MMLSNSAIGIGFLGFAAGVFMRLVASSLDPDIGIIIHSLTFTNDPRPSIIQDRTVTAQNALTASWYAEITANGVVVPACVGASVLAYPAGHKQPVLPINEWVGNGKCWDALPVGVPLQGCASYTWGDDVSAYQCTLTFRKDKQ